MSKASILYRYRYGDLMVNRLRLTCCLIILGCSEEPKQIPKFEGTNESKNSSTYPTNSNDPSVLWEETAKRLSEPAVKIAVQEAEKRRAGLVAPPPFQFLRLSLKCQDSMGRKGLNAGPDIGECANLQSRDLTGADLSSKNLRGSDFSKALLRSTNFAASDLRGADLWKSNWEGAFFKGALFNEATKLPFEKSIALSKGMIEVTYESLDLQLDAAISLWLTNSNGKELPTAIIDLFALGARPEALSDKFLKILVDKRSDQLFDLAVSNGVDFANVDQLPLILRVIDSGDVEFLKLLVSKGLSLYHQSPSKGQTLAYAIYKRKSLAIRALLQLGIAPIELKYLASEGYSEIIPDMVAAGGNIRALDKDGLSLVHYAKNLETAKLLVELGADPTRVNLIMKTRQYDLLMWLLSQGANPKVVDERGRNLLSYAIADKAPEEVVNFLFSQGVDPSNVSKDNRSLYYYAYAAGDYKTVSRLIALGVIPLGEGPEKYVSILRYIVDNNRSTFRKVLSIPGAADVLLRDSKAIWNFLARGTADEIKEAATAGIDLEIRDEWGTSLLHNAIELACSDGRWESEYRGYWLPRISALLDGGASLESKDKGDFNETPLLKLRRCFDRPAKLDLSKLLLNRGAKLDAVDSRGRGILYQETSFTSQDIPIIDFFLERGADPKNISSNSLIGTLKCDLGAQGQSLPQPPGVAIVRYLIEKGAPVDLLAHEIMSRHDTACIQALQNLFSKEFLATLNLTLNFGGTKYLPIGSFLDAVIIHLGGSRGWRIDESKVLAFHEKPEAKAFYANILAMTKSLVLKGMNANVENVEDWRFSTISGAYNLMDFQLIQYLTEIGFKSPYFSNSIKSLDIATPINACQWMSGDLYVHENGGCLARNNIIWSVPSTFDHCVPNTNGRLLCDGIGATGKVPLKEAKPGYCESKLSYDLENSPSKIKAWNTPTYKVLVAEILNGGFRKFPLDTWVLFANDGDRRGAINIRTGQLKILNSGYEMDSDQVTHLCVQGKY